MRQRNECSRRSIQEVSMDAGVDQAVEADSSGAWVLAELVLCLCGWKPVCASTLRTVLALTHLTEKHQRPWLVVFSKAPGAFQKWKIIIKVMTHPNGLLYLSSFWPLASCLLSLMAPSPTFHFYPSSHPHMSLVLYLCKAREDSRCFPGRRVRKSSLMPTECQEGAAPAWCTVS